MKISKSTAMRIVTELKNTIQQDINFMDTTALIIAGTNEKRIGTFHGGASKMLADGSRMLVVHSDGEFEGAYAGVNLTIELENEIVGVIGITGEYEEVGQYGQIIKKMTEILLLDEYLKEQKRLAQNTRNRFLQEWLYGDANRINQSFVDLGLSLEIDITIPRRVMIASVPDGSIAAGQQTVDRAERLVRRVLSEDPRNLVTVTGSRLICLVTDRADPRLFSLAQTIQREILADCSVSMRCGIDSRAVSGDQLHSGYTRAEKALRGSLSSGRDGIAFYGDIDMELFIHEISSQTKREFVARIFGDSSDEEIEQWVKLLTTFFDCNGALAQAAQKLFIHKNTLQYKLNKLTQKTGYDPRSLHGACLYQIAVSFYEERKISL